MQDNCFSGKVKKQVFRGSIRDQWVKGVWISDSAATMQMTGNDTLLHGRVPLAHQEAVTLAGGRENPAAFFWDA